MKSRAKKVAYVRNPVYIFYALGAAVLFLFAGLFAARSGVGRVEHAVFDVFYYLPKFLTPLATLLYLAGSWVVIVLMCLVLLLRRRRDVVIRVAVAAIASYGIAWIFQDIMQRGRPAELLDNVTPHIATVGFGFPSAHIAAAVAVGLTIALYAPRLYRHWILTILVLMGCACLFLGINMPLDIVGAWAIGLFCYSATSLGLGSVHIPIDPVFLAEKLHEAGLSGAKLTPASVDARGSVPFYGEYDGGKIFVKVFNKDNNAADWLFKLARRVQYRRLEDEVPSITPKRAIEHEAYLTVLAKYNAKARVPEVLGIYKVGANSYAMATQRIDATGLDKLDARKVTDDVLADAWKQIKLLHAHRVIHKDLRMANVMVENNTGQPWIIDFGFSECAVDPESFYKDNIEFIASSATKVGAKRAVAVGLQALGAQGIAELIPYTQYIALSGATTTDLKKKANLLNEVRQEMIAGAKLQPGKIKKAKLRRIRNSRNFS